MTENFMGFFSKLKEKASYLTGKAIDYAMSYKFAQVVAPYFKKEKLIEGGGIAASN